MQNIIIYMLRANFWTKMNTESKYVYRTKGVKSLNQRRPTSGKVRANFF